jgi:sodium-coupled neutral amino acid transporter 11
LADVVLVIFIAVYAPIKETVSAAGGLGAVLADDWINPAIFIGLGILSTAMACQQSSFIVSGSLANKTRARWAAVTYRSLFIATALSGIMGVCGYLGFLGTS